MLKLRNLDDRTRRFMLEEFDWDLQRGCLYLSPRLTPTGVRQYPRVLEEAIRQFDEQWLESELRVRDYIKTVEVRQNGRGTTVSTVPLTAAQTLAEEEFNRYYMRGVCRVAIASDISDVMVYRAKKSMQSTPKSESLVNQRFKPEDLLNDLRDHPGPGTILGGAQDAGDGLSVCLPPS